MRISSPVMKAAIQVMFTAPAGAGAITFVGVGAKGASAADDVTLGAPSGTPENNDIWVAVTHFSDTETVTFTDWNAIAASGTGETQLAIWYHRYAGVTPNLVVTHSGGESPIGGILSYRGCKTSGSPANVVGTIAHGVDGSIECAAITPTVANCALLVCVGAGDNNTLTALGGEFVVGFEDAAGGTQNCYNTNLGAGADGLVGCFYDLSVPASDTGIITVTQSASDAWSGVLLALEPA